MINIDFTKYIDINLPKLKKKPKFYAFMRALFYPLIWLWEYDFRLFRDRAYYLSNVTGQTLSLQEHLNNELDSVNRNIQIIHRRSAGLFVPLKSEGYEGVFISLIEEDEGEWIALEGEDTEALNTGFIVLVPDNINRDQIIGIVQEYKLAGKAYRIESN